MFESTMVLLFFFVFVGIGLVFFFNSWKQNLHTDVEKFQTLDAIKVALIASNAPEFVYTSEEWKDQTRFDLQKLKAYEIVTQYMSQDYLYNHYFSLYGYSTIVVDEIYPSTGIPEHIVLYNRTKKDWTRKQQFKMPVGLKDVIQDKTLLGVLTVEVWT